MNFQESALNVVKVYNDTVAVLDKVLIGQDDLKQAVASAILCDKNAKMLFVGDTGMGKTTLAKSLANGFNSERISVTSDLLPSDIQSQLMNRADLNLLYIDEFNRANGKVQSTFTELFEEKQMTINGKPIKFDDFYVVATQNSADIAGIFNVPQNIYDRFDIALYFEKLSEEEMQALLFSGFSSLKKVSIPSLCISQTIASVANFPIDEKDQNLFMQAFNIIDSLQYGEKKLFAGSNIRAHRFALKLAKFTALRYARNYILPCDIVSFIEYLYRHRIDQNIKGINNQDISQRFEQAKEEILELKRKK